MLKRVLSQYELVSRQKINYHKSSVSFSKYLGDQQKEAILSDLGMKCSDRKELYLGMPYALGGTRKQFFTVLTSRIWKKAHGWKEKFLSKGGKEILIKAVLQEIPTYIMSLYCLPKGTILELIIRQFWWKSNTGNGLMLVNWQRLCHKKSDSGLGFKDIELFNKALLAKQGWGLIQFPNSLVAQVLRSRYFRNGDFLSAVPRYFPFVLWRSILAGQDLL